VTAQTGGEKTVGTEETGDVTRLLVRLQDGEPGAGDALMPLIYGELRCLAASFPKAERPGHTLQPTALVHEACPKLVDQRTADYRSRAHFMAVAAMVMRRILVNHAQARAAAKRGGGAGRVPLADGLAAADAREIDMVALDEALDRLAERDSRKARVAVDVENLVENNVRQHCGQACNEELQIGWFPSWSVVTRWWIVLEFSTRACVDSREMRRLASRR